MFVILLQIHVIINSRVLIPIPGVFTFLHTNCISYTELTEIGHTVRPFQAAVDGDEDAVGLHLQLETS